MHSIREIQAKLIDLGFLDERAPDGTSNIDGDFGELTLDAYNRLRVKRDKLPVVQANPVEVEADLWPGEQPPPAPKASTIFDNPIVKLGLQLLLAKLFSGKGTAMDSTKPWYTSQTIWSDIATIAGVVLAFFHVDFGAADQAAVIQDVIMIATGASGLWGIISRIRATAKIG